MVSRERSFPQITAHWPSTLSNLFKDTRRKVYRSLISAHKTSPILLLIVFLACISRLAMKPATKLVLGHEETVAGRVRGHWPPTQEGDRDKAGATRD